MSEAYRVTTTSGDPAGVVARTGAAPSVTDTVVELADVAVDAPDEDAVVDLLVRRCGELLDTGAVGVMLADPQGRLHPRGAATEPVRMLAQCELDHDEGPAPECFGTGASVRHSDLSVAHRRWPRFAPRALAAGYRSVRAFPLRHGATVVGTLELFGCLPVPLPDEQLRLVQHLADVATIALLHQRAVRESEVLADQLRSALTSRVVIEQAKGILAERGKVDVDVAFGVLRGFARRNRLRLTDLAHQVVDGTMDTTLMFARALGTAPASSALPAAPVRQDP